MEREKLINWKKILITVLRVAIGWHFLYEGFTKLVVDNWSAAPFLANSTGPMNGLYEWLASPSIIGIVDFLNIYGLILIGLALFLGVFIRLASISGILLLILYYLAYPPFGFSLSVYEEGALYIVNKLFIEAMALLVLVFIKEKGYGLHALDMRFLKHVRKPHVEEINERDATTRRAALKNLFTLPVLGLMGWGAIRNYKHHAVDVMSGSTIQVNASSLNELKGELPKGKIQEHQISRLVLGGNLIGGWAHARDLLYVHTLFKAYNNEKKIFETLQLAEKAGINAINIGFPSNPVLEKYKKVTGSKIKVITQVAPNMESGDIYEFINKGIDYGVDIIQIQGNWCDWLVRDNKVDVIEKMMDRIRSQGYTAGLASHTVDSLIVCQQYGIIPDYYMKTMHHDKYWSAHPVENRVPFEVDGTKHMDHDKFHDNVFCLFPDKTCKFVKNATVPVMGFKVLAAGAIHPEDGFRWAFEKGADFVCVGMFDFQIVDDVNITMDVLNKLEKREREWFG